MSGERIGRVDRVVVGVVKSRDNIGTWSLVNEAMYVILEDLCASMLLVFPQHYGIKMWSEQLPLVVQVHE